MGDFVTLSLETPNGAVKVSMDYPAWRNLMAGDPHKLRTFLAKLDYFAQLPNPPTYRQEYLED